MSASSTVSELLAEAKLAGLELWVEGRRLRFRAPPGGAPAAMIARLRENRGQIIETLRAAAESRQRVGPLAENQRGLWLLSRLAPSSPAYNVALSVRMEGPLSVPFLEDALQTLVDRHDVLRTTYRERDGVPQRVVAGHSALALDLVTVPGADPATIDEILRSHYERHFDLERGPIVRATLVALSSTSHVLLVVAHHIAVDGMSIALLLDELIEVYAALESATPVPSRDEAVAYDEFVEWQQRAMADSHRAVEYWADVLTPPPPPLELPVDGTRTPAGVGRGATLWQRLDGELTSQIRDCARRRGTTDFVVLLSLWVVLLRRLTGLSDVTVGTPVAGRTTARFARAIGDFMNVVPLRVRDLAGKHFADVIVDVRAATVNALDKQDVSLPTMLEHRARRGVAAAGAPFQTQFVLQEFARNSHLGRLLAGEANASISAGAVTLTLYPLDQQQGQTQLALDVFSEEDRFRCAWRFDRDQCDHETIERWMRSFARLAQSALAEPERPIETLEVLAGEDVARLEAWNATAQAYPAAATVPAVIAAQAARTPEAEAVRAADGAYTYAQVMTRAQAISAALQAQGVARGDRVGVQLPRGRDLVPALLGVLGAGACYVPLDPVYPAERRAYMLADAGAVAVVSSAATAAEVAWTGPVVDPALIPAAAASEASATAWPQGAASDVAYVMYTSGSTGQPKGVSVSHRAVVNFLTAMAREPGLGVEDVLLAVTTVTFDIAGLELYLPLTVGARVVLASETEVADGRALAARLVGEGVTVMQATPATWKLLLATGWAGKADLRAFCGGEALPEALAEALVPRVEALWNLYGPTETTIWSTCERVTAARPILIGRPIANTTCYVLDPAGQRTPIGVPGELWIGGAGVADGYFGREALTAERFRASPYREGERLYRTGDLVRFRADGRLQHLGRLDHQVKVRGYRIELGEIEAALRAQPNVRDAVVVAEAERVLAYVVSAGAEPAPEVLRRALATTLPSYMVPAHILTLDALPLTANGKVDRRALPLPERVEGMSHHRTAPSTATELAVAAVWCETLGVASASLEDSFFELGGHSLLAVRMLAGIRDKLGVDLPIATLFESANLGALAARVETAVTRFGDEQSLHALAGTETIDF